MDNLKKKLQVFGKSISISILAGKILQVAMGVTLAIRLGGPHLNDGAISFKMPQTRVLYQFLVAEISLYMLTNLFKGLYYYP